MSDSEYGSDGADEPRPASLLASRSFVISVIVVLAIVAAGVTTTLSLVLGEDEDSPETAAEGEGVPPEGEAPGAEESAVPRSDSACGLPDGGGTTFTEWPDGTTWDPVGVMEAPSVEDQGPGVVEESGLRHCYAHSPTGAVFAAVNYSAQATDPALAYPDVLPHLLAEGPGRQAMARDLERVGPDGAGTAQGDIAGVRLLAYGTDRARVDLALLMEEEDQLVSFVVDLRWEDGDWKVVTRENGGMMIPASLLNDLVGFVPTDAGSR
ncbi:hypothetical protein ACFPZ0_04170 [Streptomonospora nanhaiensis]|uniref:hypothetical protein n=1 Tax=Streptomonospora nanhaiensis TaxID=1323731 RepID=UPI001C99BF0C|nr:hypothetical protein [Streptomonospora nanhaiensis]MBX9390120.1 hypothetical protein [Streptomonospora nanhaiensis]